MTTAFFVTAIVACALIIQSADAFLCYSCATNNLRGAPDRGYRRGFQPAIYSDACSGNPAASNMPTRDCYSECVKSIATVGDATYVLRDCYDYVRDGPSLTGIANKCEPVNWSGTVETACYCNGNLCNGSSHAKVTVSILGASLLIGYVIIAKLL